MKFPYREYVSRFAGTSDFRLILRPVITIRISGTKADARWDALVDTGADETLLPISLAEVLGVELDQEMTSEAAGISGDRLTIFYGAV
jgi:predicted aspartyl protease